MDILTVNVKKMRRGSKIPKKATDGSMGYDVYASAILDKETCRSCRSFPVEIHPGTSVLFGTGIGMEIPNIPVAIIPRSGLAMKHNIEVGCPGAPIDPDYRGEIKVLLRNLGQNGFSVDRGMRIAQLVFYTDKIIVLREVKELSKTKRGSEGLGSTGLY